MPDHDYCKLYIRFDGSRDVLLSAVSSALAAPVEGRTVAGGSLVVDCLVNKGRRDGDDFVDWPHYLEIDRADGAGPTDFVRDVQRLIDALRAGAMQVVASCDFENQLTG